MSRWPVRTDLERFYDKVLIGDDGCWIWQGSKHERGYGTFSVRDFTTKMRRAHCWAYEEFIGPIPEGLELDHLCGNTSCVSPAHLEAVTHRENMRRGRIEAVYQARRERKACRRGHPYDPENTPRATDGSRRCRVCERENERKYRERKRSA